MAIVTVPEIKEVLNFTASMGAVDDALLARKIDAAQDHLERYLGFKIADTFGGEDQDPIPPALVEVVGQLAAYWYEIREGQNSVPTGVYEVADGFKDWTF